MIRSSSAERLHAGIAEQAVIPVITSRPLLLRILRDVEPYVIFKQSTFREQASFAT